MARQKAKEIGANIPWDWNRPRTTEGYFQIRGGIEYAIAKSLAVAPFADIIWMETKTANVKDAAIFAEAIHAVYPDQMLAYNLSPSFNWDTTGMTDEEMKDYPDAGKLFSLTPGVSGVVSNKFKKCYSLIISSFLR